MNFSTVAVIHWPLQILFFVTPEILNYTCVLYCVALFLASLQEAGPGATLSTSLVLLIVMQLGQNRNWYALFLATLRIPYRQVFVAYLRNRFSIKNVHFLNRNTNHIPTISDDATKLENTFVN